ncbi:Histone deacetylase superfamily protein [Plesiocystis pacifica SIR-1]|uniref:Histone deacetylase superfamily protein n=1 Tax=Plesiocystis pacifica SIR-1 TaxID=391625 RepID=A6FY71_9BACT|nr:histone deacetylase [Plesiocystis pacifica]EDM81450.1 Histone deacetylase superfamily protein [Plesiocystis pacifica SIR-1]
MPALGELSTVPLAWRRRVQRAAARVWGERVVVVHGHHYRHEFPSVPVDGMRGERILSALVREGLVGPECVVRPTPAAFVKLARVHDQAYLERLESAAVMEQAFGEVVPPGPATAIVELQRAMVGGTMLAARAAWRRHKLAVNLGGGFHHARRDRAGGFCLLNDVAVAIAELRASGFTGPISVVDLDLHDGDGTRLMFADDPSVWTFSIHNRHWAPTQAVSSTAIALGDDVGDRDYLGALRSHLPRALDAHRPSLVFYLAGCDPADDDPLGNWHISAEAMLARDRFVLDALRARGVESVVWLLAGGYGSGAWRHSARGLIAGLGGPAKPRLPSTEAITLSRYRDLAGVLDPSELSGTAPGELVFDESDLLGVAPPDPGPARFLGYYTLSGVELGLERYGLLARLRDLGYEPRVEMVVDGGRRDSAGDTVRVWGRAQTREGSAAEHLLVEARLSRDRRTAPGFELLRIEWLLLQNPRASWQGGRVALPGQAHPGLGLFEESSLLMVMICERLGLDGIVVVPSHFHVAARWHGRMRFLDPLAEGRFRALRAAAGELPIDEASRAVEDGRVLEPEGSGLRDAGRAYEPAALVLATSPTLKARFGPQWRARADAVEALARFELGSATS